MTAEPHTSERDAEIERLQVAIRRAIVDALPPEHQWHSASCEWVQVGDADVTLPIGVHGYGGAWQVGAPRSISPLMASIKRLLATPGRGAPVMLAAFVSTEAPGVGIDASFDSRVVFDAAWHHAHHRVLAEADVRPTRAQWRDELARFPRAPEHVPSWWQDLVDGRDGGYRPRLPQWFGRPMPQTLEDAETQSRLIMPRLEGLLHRGGYPAIVDDLVAAIHGVARSLPEPGLDDLFGRRGRAAQQAARQWLADAATGAIAGRLATLSDDEAQTMIKAWHAHARVAGPDPALTRAAQLRVAVSGVAGRIVMRRFGTLPNDWHEA